MHDSPANAPPPLTPRSPFAPKPVAPEFHHYAAAFLGAIVIGVTLPTILVAVRLSSQQNDAVFHEAPLARALQLQIIATIGCGPGAVILTAILFSILAKYTREWTPRRAMSIGAASGTLIAFANLPGYLVAAFFQFDALAPLRIALLFAVAGSSCGLWIGWQAWRAYRPKERFIPRFTLRTLMIVVLLWGAAMLAFQPEKNPPKPIKFPWND